MTMSAPAPGLELEVAKPTNRLGRKEPNDDHYRSRFPSRVSTNSFGGDRQRRVPGKALNASRGSRKVLSRPRGASSEGACGHGSQRACPLVRAIAGGVAS